MERLLVVRMWMACSQRGTCPLSGCELPCKGPVGDHASLKKLATRRDDVDVVVACPRATFQPFWRAREESLVSDSASMEERWHWLSVTWHGLLHCPQQGTYDQNPYVAREALHEVEGAYCRLFWNSSR